MILNIYIIYNNIYLIYILLYIKYNIYIYNIYIIGNDTGTQYASKIFVSDKIQMNIANRVKNELQEW